MRRASAHGAAIGDSNVTKVRRTPPAPNGGVVPHLPEPGPATQARPRPGAVSGARTAPPPQPQPLAEPLKVGHVISVSGARISGILHSGGNASYVDVASAVQLGAMLKIGQRALKGPAHWALALAAFLGLYALGLPFPLVLICCSIGSSLG